MICPNQTISQTIKNWPKNDYEIVKFIHKRNDYYIIKTYWKHKICFDAYRRFFVVGLSCFIYDDNDTEIPFLILKRFGREGDDCVIDYILPDNKKLYNKYCNLNHPIWKNYAYDFNMTELYKNDRIDPDEIDGFSANDAIEYGEFDFGKTKKQQENWIKTHWKEIRKNNFSMENPAVQFLHL